MEQILACTAMPAVTREWDWIHRQLRFLLKPTTGRRSSTLRALVETLRPQQWVKNGFIFAALIFSQSLTRWDRCRQVLLAALVFCLVSSATYVLNDICDASEDRQHPLKKLRPIASGRVSPVPAGIVGAILGASA